MKGYSTFLKAPALQELHYQMQFSVIYRTLAGSGVSYPPPCRDAVDVFYSPHLTGWRSPCVASYVMLILLEHLRGSQLIIEEMEITRKN